MGGTNLRTGQILLEAQSLLETARFGLDDMRAKKGRGIAGLRNAVVFGRMITFALQNLRNQVAEFDDWYRLKQEEMKVDPLMLFFWNLRTVIEKQAKTPVGVRIMLNSFNSGELAQLPPEPPNAISFFMGDRTGGSGWEIRLPDGQTGKYYVDLPFKGVEVEMYFHEAPSKLANGLALPAAVLVEQYLDRLAALIDEAHARFAPSGTEPSP